MLCIVIWHTNLAVLLSWDWSDLIMFLSQLYSSGCYVRRHLILKYEVNGTTQIISQSQTVLPGGLRCNYYYARAVNRSTGFPCKYLPTVNYYRNGVAVLMDSMFALNCSITRVWLARCRSVGAFVYKTYTHFTRRRNLRRYLYTDIWATCVHANIIVSNETRWSFL